MSKLISELLTISRMDNNTIRLNFEAFDFGELLEFVCDEQEEIHSENITLHRNIAKNVTVTADRFMLARLCINLISNAYTYGKDNGNITVTLTQNADDVIMSVSDDGIGIAEENIPKIWERFYQADPSRTVGENGNMGLGLSMIRWIAECHNGKITVSSTLGKGSTFTFVIPKKQERLTKCAKRSSAFCIMILCLYAIGVTPVADLNSLKRPELHEWQSSASVSIDICSL